MRAYSSVGLERHVDIVKVSRSSRDTPTKILASASFLLAFLPIFWYFIAIGPVAQRQSTCFAIRRSRVQLPSGPPKYDYD